MKEDIEKLLRSEFIGKPVRVVAATNQSLIGLEGTVIDETKHTFTVQTPNGTKTIIKKNVTIELPFREKRIRVKGTLLDKRPEERIKIRVKS